MNRINVKLEFQSPIGTNKTQQVDMEVLNIADVSIPYRYKQNPTGGYGSPKYC